jgi:hypothetical protein
MIKKKLCVIFVIVAFFILTFTLSIPALSLEPNEVQVFVKNSILSDLVQLKFTEINKTYSAIAHLQDDSFNPLTASDKELISHGYPTRPKNKMDLAKWKKDVSVRLIKPNMVITNIKN